MSDNKRWEVVEDGYYKECRFVDGSTGRILGSVRGCNYSGMKSEWSAYLSLSTQPYIGSYVTEALAKRAVEQELLDKRLAGIRKGK